MQAQCRGTLPDTVLVRTARRNHVATPRTTARTDTPLTHAARRLIEHGELRAVHNNGRGHHVAHWPSGRDRHTTCPPRSRKVTDLIAIDDSRTASGSALGRREAKPSVGSAELGGPPSTACPTEL